MARVTIYAPCDGNSVGKRDREREREKYVRVGGGESFDVRVVVARRDGQVVVYAVLANRIV